MVLQVEVSNGGMELLVGNGLLKERETGDRYAVGANGEMPTTIYVPKGTGIKPLILVIHTSGGINIADHNYAMALTKEGYISVVPDFFFTAYGLSPIEKTLTWTEYMDDIHEDFTTIISQVKAMSKTPSKNVFAVGFSNGSYWAAALAARGDID